MCVCVRGFSCVPLMTAAQQGGNTHSILWPSRVLTSLPWQRRLMLWQVWFALDRNTATGLASPRVLVSSTVYKPVIFTHTHTYPYALHMQLNYILTVWARGELPGCKAPCWPLCSSRLKWDEAVWGTETVQIHVELNILHLSLFFSLLCWLPPNPPWLFVLRWFSG